MIEFYWGLPSEGKTMMVTEIIMVRMKKGRLVYSNFPIMFRYKNKQFSTLVWDDKYIYQPLHDCDIVIDEGYRTASSRDWKKFTIDEHLFYGTTGHNGIEVYFITQAIPRIEVIIREVVSRFHQIKKVSIPWPWPDPRGNYEKILWFLDEVRLQDNNKPGTPGTEIYTKVRSRFKKSVAKAYDTKFYRKPGEIDFEPQTWYKKLNIPELPPKVKISTKIKNWFLKNLHHAPTVAKVKASGIIISPPKESKRTIIVTLQNGLKQIRLPRKEYDLLAPGDDE